MPRKARISLAGVPHHIIQRGNNRSACFYSDNDYRFYLQCLAQYAQEHGCAIHAYVLMTNHVHLLMTPASAQSAAGLMKGLGQRYVQYINRKYQRTGTLWNGRFRSCLVDSEAYLLACYRYIELNPVRAKMVKHPGEYPWSSYGANAQGATSALLEPHITYRELGSDPIRRRAAYRELFRDQLESAQMDEIRQAASGNYALGSERFKKELEVALGRRVAPGKPGRPSRNG